MITHVLFHHKNPTVMNRFACLTALCLTLSLLAVPAHAGPADVIEKVLISTEVVDDYALELRLANLQQEVTKVEIKHLTRNISYFSDYIRNHNGYATLIDLQELPKGKYVLEITQGDERRTVVLRMGKHGLFVSDVK